MSDEPLIFRLLPAFYRHRDRAEDAGGGLLALATVLDEQRRVLEADIAGLYADWFVETCEPWVLPYIGDLVGLEAFERDGWRARALVADTMGFRRRKGARLAAERRLADLTGWPVQLDDSGPGRVRVRAWRLSAFRVSEATPRRLREEGQGRSRFHLNPFGVDIPLHRAPRPYPGMDAPFVEALDAPGPLTGDAADELGRSLDVRADLDGVGQLRTLSEAELAFASLHDWRIPADVVADPRKLVVIDPARGRLEVIRPGRAQPRLAVSYTYAAAAPIGGGPYARAVIAPADGDWVAHVHVAAPPEAAKPKGNAIPVFASLAHALAAYAEVPGCGLIRILDSATHQVGGARIGDTAEGCPVHPNSPRRLVIEALSGEAPCLTGAFVANGRGPGLHLVLSGLWLDGGLKVDGDAEVDLRHCTLRPRAHGRREEAVALAADDDGATPRLRLQACLSGPIKLGRGVELFAADSVVDGDPLTGAIVGHAAVSLVRTTVLAPVAVARLDATDVIFAGGVEVAEIGHGAVRASALPPGARPPPPAADCVTIGPETPLVFVSRVFGDPGYARLADHTAAAITTGGTDGGEMGAHHAQRLTARAALLKLGLAAYLPLGVDWRLAGD